MEHKLVSDVISFNTTFSLETLVDYRISSEFESQIQDITSKIRVHFRDSQLKHSFPSLLDISESLLVDRFMEYRVGVCQAYLKFRKSREEVNTLTENDLKRIKEEEIAKRKNQIENEKLYLLKKFEEMPKEIKNIEEKIQEYVTAVAKREIQMKDISSLQ
jgi:hypothetical protein